MVGTDVVAEIDMDTCATVCDLPSRLPCSGSHLPNAATLEYSSSCGADPKHKIIFDATS